MSGTSGTSGGTSGLVLHDLDCPLCGFVEDAMVERETITNNTAICECGSCAEILWTKAPTVTGIVWSGRNGPRTSKQLGVTWTTNAEKRAWEQRNQNVVEIEKGSPDDVRLGTSIRDRAEAVARRLGYRDLDHRRASERAERAKGWKSYSDDADCHGGANVPHATPAAAPTRGEKRIAGKLTAPEQLRPRPTGGK